MREQKVLNMPYKLHLNLQQIAALRIAISFWEKKEVKDSVRKFFNSCHKLDEHKDKYKWQKLTKALLDEWNKDILSLHLEVDVVYIVNKVGEEIYHWYWYIKHENRFDNKAKEEAIKYIDKIHWTPYGTIDEVKTFKSFWFKNPSLEISQVYCIACKYALKKYIHDLWNRMSEHTSIHECWNHDEQIVAYWKYTHDGDLSSLIKSFKLKSQLYNPNHSAEENMLRLSVNKGYNIAVQYFWKKLSEEEKNRNMLDCAGSALILYSKGKQIFINERYNKMKYVEICIFLMNHMTRDQKKSFFNGTPIFKTFDEVVHIQQNVRSIILNMFLSVWPWQELFMTALNDMLQYEVLDSKTVCIVLHEITTRMVKDHKLGYDIEFRKYRKLFREVWLFIPGSIKQKMVQENSFSNFTCNLLHVWDLDRIRMIFNDEEIADVRDQYIESGKQKYRLLMMRDQFELLDQFMEKVFKSEEEKKCFKRKMYDWYGSIETDQFCLPETVLSWGRNTPYYMPLLKRSCEDHINLYQVFIKSNRYDLVNKFLNWTCETEEEKNKCKNHIKHTNFSFRWLCGIWKECKRDIQREPYKFLDWLLESELFIPVWNDMVQYIELDSETVGKVLYKITTKMVEDCEMGCAVENSKYQSILRAAWLLIPGFIKQKMARSDLRLDFIHHLLDVWDLDNIKLIFNDPEIADIKDQYVESGIDQYRNLIKKDKYELLDQLIEEVFILEEEKRSFRRKIDCWYHFIFKDQYHLAEKLLDWQCTTPEERQSIKSGMDHIRVCKNFLQKRSYDLAVKFLNWKCETEEEKKKCWEQFYISFII